MAEESEIQVENARSASKGGLAVLFAKGYFIAIGLVQQALLPLAIGIAGYGALSRVLAVSNIFNNVVVSSSIQGVSREVASSGAHADERFRSAIRVHGRIALLLALFFLALAPAVAAFQHSKEIVQPLLVMAIVLGVYGFYAPLVGYLNGRGMFVKQASLDVLAATLRTIGFLAVGYSFRRSGGSGALGATVGAAFAALAILSVALTWTSRAKMTNGVADSAAPAFSTRIYLRGLLPMMLAQLFTNALMQADILMLGRFLSISAVSEGVATPEVAANEWVGVYRACQLFAFLPYQLLFSITQVLFPMLAKTRAEHGDEAAKSLVSSGTRLGILVCGLLLSAVVALPESLIRFAFGAAIAARGAPTLRVLALGQATFAIIGLGTTVLVSLGREKVALMVTVSALAFVAIACVLGIPGAHFGSAQLERAALMTSVALALGLIVAWTAVKRVVGAFVPALSFVRVAGGIAILSAIGHFVPPMGRFGTIVGAMGAVGVYVAWLFVSRELSSSDIAWLKGLARRGQKK